MNTLPTSKTQSITVLLLAVALALIAALTYGLIARGLMPVGGLTGDQGMAGIMYAAAAGYLLGGLLILLRWRWLWIVGAVINALVVLFFITKYISQPTVVFSPGGLISKTVQILLEAALIYLVISRYRDH